MGEQNLELAELLINAGANVDVTDELYYPPLYMACDMGADQMVPLLIAKGADVNASGEYGQSPLHAACASQGPHTVTALLKAGANVNAQDEMDFTPLHVAIVEGKKENVEILLKHGASLSITNDTGETPLIYLVRPDTSIDKRALQIAFLLLKNGALATATTNTGSIALHYLCEGAQQDDSLESRKLRARMASHLLYYGARIDAKDGSGQTPIDLAAKKKLTLLLQVFCTVRNFLPHPSGQEVARKQLSTFLASLNRKITDDEEGDASLYGGLKVLAKQSLDKFCPEQITLLAIERIRRVVPLPNFHRKAVGRLLYAAALPKLHLMTKEAQELLGIPDKEKWLKKGIQCLVGWEELLIRVLSRNKVDTLCKTMILKSSMDT